MVFFLPGCLQAEKDALHKAATAAETAAAELIQRWKRAKEAADEATVRQISYEDYQ